MHNWFECKVSFEKIMENGAQKKVTEPDLVDCLSFTEAEARIIEEIRPFVSGEFTVTDTNAPVCQNCSSTKMATVSIRSRFTSSPSMKKAERKENSCTDAGTGV